MKYHFMTLVMFYLVVEIFLSLNLLIPFFSPAIQLYMSPLRNLRANDSSSAFVTDHQFKAMFAEIETIVFYNTVYVMYCVTDDAEVCSVSC